jgi:RNA polymerase sigma-70 factor, ECF subfamily
MDRGKKGAAQHCRGRALVTHSPEVSAVAAAEAQASADLVARIAHGDRSAETAMVERYARGLLYLLRRRTGDAELALDVRQDTFRIAIEKLRTAPLNEPERLAAYLRGIALNLLTADIRKTIRRGTTADSDAIEAAADDTPGPYDDVSREQAGAAIRAMLAELRVPRDREILIRVYLDEEDKESICDALGIDGVHFNRVLFRARQRFRELLGGKDGQRRLRLIR